MPQYGLAITMIMGSVLGLHGAPAQRSALLNILASDPMRAESASHITISANLFVG